ncbi:MAG: hypothetical protein ACQXXJ_04435, partial [Candidatus Bathyarchaeia archaeon]
LDFSLNCSGFGYTSVLPIILSLSYSFPIYTPLKTLTVGGKSSLRENCLIEMRGRLEIVLKTLL